MSLSRRKFLVNAALTYVGVTGTLFSASHFVISLFNDTVETTAEKLRRAAMLRREYLANPARNERNLTIAGDIYRDIISTESSEIRAYNGLRKIYLYSKYKELDVYKLYYDAYNLNDSDRNLIEGLAKESMRLSVGNKKFCTDLGLPPRELLKQSHDYFFELQRAKPDSIQYQAQFQKAYQKIVIDCANVDARDNRVLKSKKRDDRQNYKDRFKDYPSVDITERLQRLLIKPLHKDRINNIKDVYRILIDKLILENNPADAVTACRDLYYYDVNDTNSLYLARKYALKYSELDVLEEINRNNLRLKNSFWAKIALTDTLLIINKINGTSTLEEVRQLLDSVSRIEVTFNEKFELRYRLIKLSLAKNELSFTESELISFGKMIKGISSAHLIDKFNRLCCDYYTKSGAAEKQYMVIDYALKQIVKKPEGDLLMKEIFLVNKNRVPQKPIHDQVLAAFRSRLS